MSLTIVQTTEASNSSVLRLQNECAVYRPALEALANLFNACNGLDDPLSLELRRWTRMTVLGIEELSHSGETDVGLQRYAEERITLLADMIFTALGDNTDGHEYAKGMLDWIASITIPGQQLVRVVREEDRLVYQIASRQWKVAFRIYNACRQADAELNRAIEIRDAAREENHRVMEACLRLRDELREEVTANISEARDRFDATIAIERKTAENLRHDVDYAEERLDGAHTKIDQLTAENNAVKSQLHQTQCQVAEIARQRSKKSCVLQ